MASLTGIYFNISFVKKYTFFFVICNLKHRTCYYVASLYHLMLKVDQASRSLSILYMTTRALSYLFVCMREVPNEVPNLPHLRMPR